MWAESGNNERHASQRSTARVAAAPTARWTSAAAESEPTWADELQSRSRIPTSSSLSAGTVRFFR